LTPGNARLFVLYNFLASFRVFLMFVLPLEVRIPRRLIPNSCLLASCFWPCTVLIQGWLLLFPLVTFYWSLPFVFNNFLGSFRVCLMFALDPTVVLNPPSPTRRPSG